MLQQSKLSNSPTYQPKAAKRSGEFSMPKFPAYTNADTTTNGTLTYMENMLRQPPYNEKQYTGGLKIGIVLRKPFLL